MYEEESEKIYPEARTYWKSDFRYFDQHNLKELTVDHTWGRFQNSTSADKIFKMNYDIHVRAILGLPSKILAFIASLIAASLPISGFYIWWGERTKRKKRSWRQRKMKLKKWKGKLKAERYSLKIEN